MGESVIVVMLGKQVVSMLRRVIVVLLVQEIVLSSVGQGIG